MVIRREATATIGPQHRATLVPVHDTFIPIHSGGSCAGLGHLPERPPQLQGDAKELQRLIDALQPVVQAELGAAEPVGAWLRALEVSRDEATLVLAKELATMDLLSDGRVEIGLGAGWMISDYEQLGIPYDAPGVRIDRFLEGLGIIKQCMQPGAFSQHGTHYTVTGYDGLPKPVQAKVPVLIGGGGKRVLSIAAREADIVGINPSMHAGVVGPEAFAHMTEAAVDEKVAIVRAAAGDRLADIEMNIRAFLVNVTDDGAGARSRLAGMLSVDEAMLLSSPFALIGSPAELTERLLERRERWGFSYVIVGAEDVDKFAPVVAALAGK